MHSRRFLVLLLTASLAGTTAYASPIDSLSAISQAQFQNLTSDLGAALSYKDMMPAAPLGLTGFDVGVTAMDTHVDYAGALQGATGSSASNLFVPSLQAQKGLPLGFDVGLTYGGIPGSNVRVVGGDISYAVIGGGLLAPALTVRGTYTRMLGVSQMGLNTRSVELCLSKGFVFITPYIGVGRVRTAGIPRVGTLSDVTVDDTKEYVGADFNLGLLNLDLEVDRMAGSTSYGANIGWRL
ncbi:hypothetical protein [Acidiferrobacter sp.]|uniref:hypothetical protein n=1 Tax=Acidiferrobacter sp. TaxID=1872107 RepID=UPI00263437C2|nr:hypothetical protein [Acidiferrobacter sp.]